MNVCTASVLGGWSTDDELRTPVQRVLGPAGGARAACCGVRAGDQRAGVLPDGQNIAPVYEGWEQNPDGSFNLVFGYFNRNWDEEIDVPIGPDNSIEPGGPDQGQPTHFFPRRNRFLFRDPRPEGFRQQGSRVDAHQPAERPSARTPRSSPTTSSTTS